MQPIKAYFDFAISFCMIAVEAVRRLTSELGLAFEWRPWEAYHENPLDGVPASHGPSMLSNQLASELGLRLADRKHWANTRKALIGSIYAMDKGKFESYRDATFRAYWVKGLDIGRAEVLRKTVQKCGLGTRDFFEALESSSLKTRLDAIEREAEKDGVEVVPTFVSGSKKIAGNISYKALCEQLLQSLSTD